MEEVEDGKLVQEASRVDERSVMTLESYPDKRKFWN